jgi:hypothetical protein
MEGKTPSAHGASPRIASSSLAELPLAAQNHLAFGAIVTALGFSPDAIGHRVDPARPIGIAAEPVLRATLTANGREFTLALGVAVPDMDAWLVRAAELWACAAPAAHEALYDRCMFFQRNGFADFLTAMTRSGLSPPIAAGLVVSRLERAGIGAALRRSGPLNPPPPSSARPSRASAPPAAPPPGPPRFEVGEVTHIYDQRARLPEAELAPLVRRHASGDWGESLYTEDNEAALSAGRPIMSMFRTAADRQLLLITWPQPPRTSVWLQTRIEYPEAVLLDLVCSHVGTGRRAELPPGAHGALYAVPLIGHHAPHDGAHIERAALAVLGVLSSDPANEVPYRAEQLLRALWRAVAEVDFRPIDRNGQRVPVDAPKATWEAAFQRCTDEHIGAWFSVLWEDRLA